MVLFKHIKMQLKEHSFSVMSIFMVKKKKMIQSQVFSAIASPGTCGKLREDWDTNLWNVFSLPLTVEIFHLFECHLMIMVRKHIPVIVV